jgi:GNAT superfamily N-acetyltransferase
MALLIRQSRQDDSAAIRQCIVELQEFERGIDPRLRPGESMADAYWDQIQERCAAANGVVYVAIQDEALVGFVAVLAEEPFEGLDNPPGTYGLVSDIVVLGSHRGQGIGRKLLEQAEAFVRAVGARELRIGVLSGNQNARRLYLNAGFLPSFEILTKNV